MKPTCIILFLTVHILHAQPSQLTLQPAFFNENVGVVRGRADELLLTTKDKIYDMFDAVHLTRIDESGQHWSTTFVYVSANARYEALSVGNFYATLDVGFECDIVARRLSVWDQTGAFFQVAYLHDYPFDWELPFKLLPVGDTSLWVLQPGKEALRFHFPSLTFQGSSPFPDFFTGHLTLPNDRLLLFGDKGLFLYDAALMRPIDSVLLPQPVIDAARLPDGRFSAIVSDRLYHFDEQLNVVSEQFHNGYLPSGEALELVVADSSLWLLGANGELARFDLQVQHDTTYLSDQTHAATRHIAAFSNRLYLVQEETNPVAARPQVLQVQAFPAAEWTHNAGVEDISVAAVVGSYVNYGYYDPLVKIRMDSVRATVRNTGAEPLTTFTLNGFFQESNFAPSCPEKYVYQQTFSVLNLLPGETVEVLIDSVVFFKKYFIPQTHHFCLWTTRPNGLLDADRSDDRTCRTYPVTVGAFEAEKTLPLAIFPNPATEQCTIRLPDDDEPEWLRLFDDHGRLIRDMPAAGNPPIDRRDLPAGRYTCLVTSKGGKTYSGVIVWQ